MENSRKDMGEKLPCYGEKRNGANELSSSTVIMNSTIVQTVSAHYTQAEQFWGLFIITYPTLA